MATEKEQSSGCGWRTPPLYWRPESLQESRTRPCVSYEGYETGGGSTTALITYATESGINQETAPLPWSKDLEVSPGTPITLSTQAQGPQAYLSVCIIQKQLAYESPTANCNGDYYIATVGTIARKKPE